MSKIGDQIVKIVDAENDYVKATVTPLGAKGAQTVEIVNASGDQITDFTGDGVATGVGDGNGYVDVAGIPEQLPDVTCKRVFIQAHTNNEDAIAIGSASVVAALDGRKGLILESSQGEWFNVNNLNLLYIDAVTAGFKYHYFYET